MVGIGCDLHKLEKGKKLIIGAVPIESEYGAVAHSDGDVLIHALVDAILGAAGLGDIGEHFPDSNPKYYNADSTIFLKKTIRLLEKSNFKLINIDITISLEKPKLSQYKGMIKQSISHYCKISDEKVNVKAKTGEGIGIIGRKEAISAICVCEIQ